MTLAYLYYYLYCPVYWGIHKIKFNIFKCIISMYWGRYIKLSNQHHTHKKTNEKKKWQSSSYLAPLMVFSWVKTQWFKAICLIHTYNGILLSHKKEWNNVNCSDRDSHRDCHIEWSKTEKDKYHMISLTCGILKNGTKQKKSHRCRKQTYGYQRGKGGGINWKIGIDTYTLLCIK